MNDLIINLCKLIADNAQTTENIRIMKAHEDFLPWLIFSERLDALKQYCLIGDLQGIEKSLLELVSGYAPDRRENK